MGLVEKPLGRWRGMTNQNVRVQFHEFFCFGLNATRIGVPPAIVDPNILTVFPAELLKPFAENADALADIGIAFGDRHQNTKPPNPVWLLRVSGQRPCCRRTAQNFDELAPPHWRPLRLRTGDRNGSNLYRGSPHRCPL